MTNLHRALLSLAALAPPSARTQARGRGPILAGLPGGGLASFGCHRTRHAPAAMDSVNRYRVHA